VSCRCSKNWTITNPKPISATAARTHAMSVRSSATRVRIHPKWLSEVIRQIARLIVHRYSSNVSTGRCTAWQRSTPVETICGIGTPGGVAETNATEHHYEPIPIRTLPASIFTG
jgi:hypothetical protein